MKKTKILNFKNEKLLVIAPHADDEILGCGGLMSRVKEDGGKVFVLIFNVGAVTEKDSEKNTKIWKKETGNAMKFLNVDKYDTVFDSAKDNRFLDVKPMHDLIEIIETKSKVSLNKIKPTMIAIPTRYSHHQDHIRLFDACIAALRPKGNTPSNMVFSYEAPEHSRWSTSGVFEPNYFINIEKQIKKKIKAFYKYKSQVKKGVRDDITIKTQASYRGRETGSKYCEAFYIHRMFV